MTLILCLLSLIGGFVFGVAWVLSYLDSRAPLDPRWQQRRGRK